MEASSKKPEILDTMAHDLRTPLNAIIGFSEALKDGLVGPTSEAQHKIITDIYDSGQQLLALINGLLDDSKNGAGTTLPGPGPGSADVTAPGDRTLSLGARLTAVSELKERIALVVEDDDKTAELVRLLLVTEGFTVLLANSAEAALVMAPKQALSLITLDIRMPGMDGWEFLRRIRRMKALSHVPVVIIAGVTDSNITLTDGAAGVLQKPISRAQLKSTLADLGLHPHQGRAFTVLVVDDDPKAVEVIAAFLPAPTYSVLRAYGGGEAIGMAQRTLPDLVLLDLMMPEVTGFDVVDALRRTPSTSGIPIVIVTAKGITAKDRAMLNDKAGSVIQIVEKAGFNRAGFTNEVRRALRLA